MNKYIETEYRGQVIILVCNVFDLRFSRKQKKAAERPPSQCPGLSQNR